MCSSPPPPRGWDPDDDPIRLFRGRTFSKFLKEMVTSGLDFGESPVPVWTKESRALFASRLRSAPVTISYAIARCVANALIYGSKSIARYPVREAVGPVGI